MTVNSGNTLGRLAWLSDDGRLLTRDSAGSCSGWSEDDAHKLMGQIGECILHLGQSKADHDRILAYRAQQAEHRAKFFIAHDAFSVRSICMEWALRGNPKYSHEATRQADELVDWLIGQPEDAI